MGRSLGEISGRCQGSFTPLIGPSCAFLGRIGNLPEVEQVINRRPITCLWESSEPGGGVSIPLCPEQFLLPPRTDGKEEERELNVSKEFQQRKKWVSSMNDLWKKAYLHQVLGYQGEV